jgi:hypothetical protein
MLAPYMAFKSVAICVTAAKAKSAPWYLECLQNKGQQGQNGGADCLLLSQTGASEGTAAPQVPCNPTCLQHT